MRELVTPRALKILPNHCSGSWEFEAEALAVAVAVAGRGQGHVRVSWRPCGLGGAAVKVAASKSFCPVHLVNLGQKKICRL